MRETIEDTRLGGWPFVNEYVSPNLAKSTARSRDDKEDKEDKEDNTPRTKYLV